MPTPNGMDFLIKIDVSATATANYATVAMMQGSLKVNNEIVDVTDQESARWRELLVTAGTKSVTVSGSGVFKDASAQKKVNEYSLAGTARKFQVIVPELGTYEGTFVITDFEASGDHNKHVAFSMTIQSATAVTFVAL